MRCEWLSGGRAAGVRLAEGATPNLLLDLLERAFVHQAAARIGGGGELDARCPPLPCRRSSERLPPQSRRSPA
jgi:hypothetical protein